MIAVAIVTFRHRGDTRQQSTCSVAWFDIRIDLFDELMMYGTTHLQTVDCFTVGLVRFATDVVADASLCHEVPFVSCIDKDSRFERTPALHDDVRNSRTLFDHATFKIQPLSKDDRYFCLGNHVVEDLGCHVRFKRPHRFFVFSPIFEIGFAGLASPTFGCKVVFVDALVELAGQSANRALIADIGCT